MTGSTQMAQNLASEIAAGRWPPGSALPSTRMLAADLWCAPGTVARAAGLDTPARAAFFADVDRALGDRATTVVPVSTAPRRSWRAPTASRCS